MTPVSKRFFDLDEDVHEPGRWYLAEPTDSSGKEVEDVWAFGLGRPVEDPGQLRIPLGTPGKPLDFDRAGVGPPIVSARVASVFRALAPDDIQLFPVEVEGQSESYFLLNVARKIRCIDDSACLEVQFWTSEDGRPDRVGEYRAVSGLRIDTSKVGDARVFRPWGWSPPIIVAEEIKDALERLGVVGVHFQPVTGPQLAPGFEELHANPPLLRQMRATREAVWRNLGAMDEEVFAPIIPQGAVWPAARQAWRRLRRPEGHTLWVSDGLSDPFSERAESSIGFGLELLLETAEPVPHDGGWPLRVLRHVSHEVAGHAHLREALLSSHPLSMEVPGEGIPEPLVTKEGRVGVLLGMPSHSLPATLSTPAGAVRLVTLKVLHPRELAFLLQHGKAALLQRFADRGEDTLSRSWRQPRV